MTQAARWTAASRCRNRPPARWYGATGSLVAHADGLASLSSVLGSVLEMDNAVVTEQLEQPVLRRQIDEGLRAAAPLLVDRVLRYVDQVTRGELPARRLFRDPRVVLVLDLGLRSEEHTSELQSPCNLVCRLLLEKKKCEYSLVESDRQRKSLN